MQPAETPAAASPRRDDFKRVNDAYGHALGELALTELAAQLRGAVRESDDVCRVGGEEFGVMVRGDLGVATGLARRIAERLADTYVDPVGGLPPRSGSRSDPSTPPIRASSSPAPRPR